MKFTHFFIARPVFAIVLSLLMLLAGAIAFLQLPLSEYPAVTPPQATRGRTQKSLRIPLPPHWNR